MTEQMCPKITKPLLRKKLITKSIFTKFWNLLRQNDIRHRAKFQEDRTKNKKVRSKKLEYFCVVRTVDVWHAVLSIL